MFGQRLGNVLANQVDPGNVQADDTCRQRTRRRGVGVNFVGAVESVVGGALDQHLTPGSGNGIGVQPLAFEFDAGGGVNADHRQGMQFRRAAPWVAIDLAVDQFAHRRLTIAGDRDHFTAVGSNHLVADDQQSMFNAGNRAFDQHAGTFVHGDGVGFLDLLAGGQVDEDAAAMIAVDRFDANRQADVFGGFPGIVGAADFPAFRHRYAAIGQQCLGQVLVARDGFGNRAGGVGFGSPDAPHRRPVTELHQIAVIEQTDGRNVAVVGGVDNTCGRRPQTAGIDQIAQVFDGSSHIEWPVFDTGHDQIAAIVQRPAGHFFVEGTDNHLVDAALTGFARFAKTAGQAGEVLQFKRHVFEDMARPGAFLDPAQETAALLVAAAVFDQRGQQGHQAVVKTGDGVGGKVLQLANIDPGFEHWPVSPDIGPLQGNDVADDDVFHGRGLTFRLTGSGRAGAGCAGRVQRHRESGTGYRGCRQSAAGCRAGGGYLLRP